MKNSRFAKVIALLLALVMLVAMTACGNNAQGNDDTTPTPATDATPTPGIDLTEGGKYMDYEGAGGIDDYRLQAFDFKSNEITLLSAADGVGDPAKFDALRDVYNIKCELVTTTVFDISTRYIAMYMGDEAPDVARFGLPISMINKGYFSGWEEYINFDLGLWKDIKSSVDNLWFRGHIYTIFNTPARWDNVCWYNKDLFEEAGVKTPTEYYEEGNWTWDTFRECALAMHTDSDGDGIPEIWGCDVEPIMFIWTTGLDYISMNKDGTFTNNIMSDEIARGITFYTEMVNSDGVVYDGSDTGAMFGAGKIALMSANCWIRTFFPDLLKQDSVAIVPYPKDPKADKYYLGEGFMAYNLSAKASNPEGAAAFVCAQRYHQLMLEHDAEAKAEREALSISEQVDTYGWPNYMDDFVFGEMRSDKFTPVLDVSGAFDFNTNFSAALWFRPLMGEPWATIASEIDPMIDELMADLLEE
ncbi:MAG: extracellular solute-binding protein [Ruminococcaceae bacterium]|nr:extracellular solute-binding protein [Oscillospiraceae bacterium]